MQITNETEKELKRIYRDRIAFLFQLLYPIIMIFIIGTSLSGGEEESFENMKLAIIDYDNSSDSRETIELFQEKIEDTRVVKDEETAKELMRKGEIIAYVILPEKYDLMILSVKAGGGTLSIDVYIDNAVIATDYSFRYVLQLIENNVSTELNEETLQDVEFTIERHKAFGDVNYIDKITPGLIISSILITGIIGTTLSISRERESGVLFRVATTTAKKYNIILGKILANSLIVLVQSFLLIMTAYFIFDVPINGSIAGLALICALTSVLSVCIGIAISAVTKTTRQSLYAALLVNIPLAFFCGQFWPITFMPFFARSIAEKIPITLAVDDCRNLMIRGAVFSDVIFTSVILAISSIIIAIIGSLFFDLKRK